MPPLPPPLTRPVATSLGLLGWRDRTDEDRGLERALFAAQRRAELDLLGGDPDQQATFIDLQLRARAQHRDVAFPAARLGVLTVDDVPVGQLDLQVGDAVLDLLELHVVPGLRGHGLGTAALRAVLAHADAAGLTTRLHVEPANPARRLYERVGFVTTEANGVHVAMERAAETPTGGAPGSGEADAPSAAPTGPPGEAAPPGEGSFPSHDELAAHLGATVACGDDGPDLELVAVDLRPRRTPDGRVPYSALLAGPLDRPLEQGMHVLDLPGSGPIEVFIVPIQPVDGRSRYELLVS